MSDVFDDFITLTPLNCVQQVNSLLATEPPKQQGCGLFLSLFGVYCGVLIYRAYRNYCRDREAIANQNHVTAKIEVISSVPTPSLVSEHASSQTPILLQPVSGTSASDMRWRYGNPQKASTAFRVGSEDEEEIQHKRHVLEKGATTASTVSIATSTTMARPAAHDGESTKTSKTPFRT
ncbi:uncharacterized protein [Drosophila bipectinata]|uniref:uncharacterized protein n=1 Tax=Drosophila bipectinata TaxID=42026 RepID=UPI001C8A587C|nr:uncharacterized protein LOC108131582 [Drosophila bipectinata]